MAVAVNDFQVGGALSGVTASVTFTAPVNRSDLIWVALIFAATDMPGVTYLFNGANPGDSYEAQTDGVTGVEMVQSIWNAAGGEQTVTVTIDTPFLTWFLIAAQITGDAHLPPYDIDSTTGVGPTAPETPSTYIPDTGVALSLAVVPETTLIAEPSGWTLLSVGELGSLSFAAAERVVALSVLPPSAWGATVSADVAWLSTIISFQDIAQRLPPATAYASNPGGILVAPGPVEPPNPVDPFIPETNPLPPMPTEIEVPLEPWIPKPGPYRP